MEAVRGYATGPSAVTGTGGINPAFVQALAVSADGEWVAVGLGDSSVRIGHVADVAGGGRSRRLHARTEGGHNHMVTAVYAPPRPTIRA
jgi:hypothetical protein